MFRRRDSVTLGWNGTARVVRYSLRSGRRSLSWLPKGEERIDGVAQRTTSGTVALFVIREHRRLFVQHRQTRIEASDSLTVDFDAGPHTSRLRVSDGDASILVNDRDERITRHEQSWEYLAFVAYAITTSAESARLIDLWDRPTGELDQYS